MRMRTQSLSPVGKGPIKAFPVSTVKKEETESDDKSTMVESDLNTTVIPKEPNQSGPLPLRTPTGISPCKPPVKLTYGVSPTLDEDKEVGVADPFLVGNIKEESLPEYTHGDLFLPIPGTLSINDLEPEETLQLMTHGNRVKIVTIKLWGPRYQTDRFMIDDLTGEIYAIREGGMDLIKEQAFLDRRLAWDAAAVEFPDLFFSPIKKDPPDKTKGRDSSLDREREDNSLSSEEKKQNTPRYQEFRETLQRYQSVKDQRRRLEGELMFFELPGKEAGVTTDQEVERERVMALVQHKKALDQEIPLFKKCIELAPEDPESEDERLSQISRGSYECEKDWTEPTYRRALFIYERRSKKASILSHLRDVKAGRYPHRASNFNRELFEVRERWAQKQKEGEAMLKVVKMEVDFKRKRHNLVYGAVQEERSKWEEKRMLWERQKEEEFEERRKNWAKLTEKELVRQQQAFSGEKEEWQNRMKAQENQYKEELSRKTAQEIELIENFRLQQQKQEEMMNLQKEEYEKGYQGLQEDQIAWKENQKEKDQLVEELRDALKKNQEVASEQLNMLKQQMNAQESRIVQLTKELDMEKTEKKLLMDATKKRIGQLEEQRSLLERNQGYDEHVTMKRETFLGVADGTIPKGKWSGEKDKTVRFEETGMSQGRDTLKMDWDYESRTMAERWEKGVPTQMSGNPPKRTMSTPMEGAIAPPSFEETEIRQRFFCENCRENHEPPVCPCPICEQRGHLVADCPYRDTPESSQLNVEGNLKYPWKECPTCLSHHQGICPCKVCDGLGHIEMECPTIKRQRWQGTNPG